MNLFKKELILTKQEEAILDIVKSMLDKECLIEINPENMDYLLSIEKIQYYLLIDFEGVQISNHSFFITRRLRNSFLDKLKSIVKVETSRRRQLKINNIFNNEIDLLTEINKTIKNQI